MSAIRPTGDPLPYRPHGLTVASYRTYLEAQAAVDHLSDSGFPVQTVAIVGNDLRLVEQVTGRLTRGRALGAGAGTGAWFGLFVGLLIALFVPRETLADWVAVVLTGVVIGAFWGLLLAWFGYAATGGRRDFLSRSGVVAERYDVVVRGEGIDQARQMLQAFAAGGGPTPLAPAGTAPPPAAAAPVAPASQAPAPPQQM
jgi:hypothetical protein